MQITLAGAMQRKTWEALKGINMPEIPKIWTVFLLQPLIKNALLPSQMFRETSVANVLLGFSVLTLLDCSSSAYVLLITDTL